MFSGWSRSRWIPRKTAGSAIRMIDWLIDAIRTPSVVFESAIHLYPGSTAPRPPSIASEQRDRVHRRARPPGDRKRRDAELELPAALLRAGTGERLEKGVVDERDPERPDRGMHGECELEPVRAQIHH